MKRYAIYVDFDSKKILFKENLLNLPVGQMSLIGKEWYMVYCRVEMDEEQRKAVAILWDVIIKSSTSYYFHDKLNKVTEKIVALVADPTRCKGVVSSYYRGIEERAMRYLDRLMDIINNQ